MRYLKADGIFDGRRMHLNKVLLMDGETVFDLLDESALTGSEEVEYFSGVLSPGFVNTHCHLELSHLQGEVPQKTGLPGFIAHIQQLRQADEGRVREAINNAARKMKQVGVVGLGDISNGLISLEIKKQQLFQNHTFVEVFGLDSKRAEAIFQRATALWQEFCSVGNASIVPHAPYSVSKELFEAITTFKGNTNQPVSMHNQECFGENEMFEQSKGALWSQLKQFGLPLEDWTCPKTSSLRAVIPFSINASGHILVHNTFSSEKDIRWAQSKHEFLFWCTCPRANLYIEDRLPDYQMMMNLGIKLCIGTDSLASNDRLSVWEELKTIHQYYPDIALDVLLTWATSHGAEALQFNNLGVFEKGKSPGVVYLPQGLAFEGNSSLLINFAKS